MPPPAALPPPAVQVAYDIGGRCAVSIDQGTPAVAPSSTEGGRWRCDLPALPPKTAIRLRVTLPAGALPGGDAFPRLRWTPASAADAGAVGEADLPAAPAFVSVALAGTPAAGRARWLDILSLAATATAALASLVYGRRA